MRSVFRLSTRETKWTSLDKTDKLVSYLPLDLVAEDGVNLRHPVLCDDVL